MMLLFNGTLSGVLAMALLLVVATEAVGTEDLDDDSGFVCGTPDFPDIFALRVGNVWEYDNGDTQCDWTTIEVVKDSIINEHEYYKILQTDFCGGEVSQRDPLWVRLTYSSFEVVQYSFRRQSDVLMLPLAASEGDTWEGWEPLRPADHAYGSDEDWVPTGVMLRRGVMQDMNRVHIDFLENQSLFCVRYDLIGLEADYVYADWFGLVGWWRHGNMGLILRGAIILGVPYGTFTVGVEPSSWGCVKALFGK